MTSPETYRHVRILVGCCLTLIPLHPLPVIAAIVLNEIHYHPPSDDQGGEFIELINTGPTPVNLKDWTLEGGIGFRLGEGNTIPPGGYGVIAGNLTEFHASFPSFVGSATGGFARNLGNSGDLLELRNPFGELIDEVSYLDDPPWPVAADGTGASLELLHPGLDNSQPGSWKSSQGLPTPGSQNSVYTANPSPILSEIRHAPLVPKANEPVAILARATDNQALASVKVYWRIAATTETIKRPAPQPTPTPPNQTIGFLESILVDDGNHSDGLAGDGTYGGTLPGQADKSVIEFYIQARDTTNQSTTVPSTAPGRNALIQVDNQLHPDNIPLYRVVMTPTDLEALRTRGVFSDELLNCTLIADGRPYYRKGIRYRGSSSRVLGPRESFRIELESESLLGDQSELNLNGNGALQQALAWDLSEAGNLSNPRRKVVNLVLNNQFHRNYYQIESIDTPFLEFNFGDDHGGNLYRGIENANLEYLGPDPNLYRQAYEKENNREVDDYSDLIGLTETFSSSSEEVFTEEIPSRIDVAQWLNFFAFQSILSNSENGIQLNTGDDYFLYSRETDGRFLLLPWDLDGTFGNTGELLFRQKLPAIARLVQHPSFVRLYYLGIEQALSGWFHPAEMAKVVDRYRGIFTDQELDGILFITEARWHFLQDQYPRGLTVEIPDGEFSSIESCPRPVLSQTTLRMQGESHAAYTAAVRINGTTVDWRAMEGRWEGVVSLEPGENSISIEAVNEIGVVFEQAGFSAYRADRLERLGGELTGDAHLTEASSPYLIESHLTIPSTATLKIDPGCLLFLDEGVGILVNGRVEACGTNPNPIRFRPLGCGRWGGIGIQSTGSRFSHCEFYRASSTDIKGIPVPMAITLNGGGAEVEESHFFDCIRCFNVNAGGTLQLRDTTFFDCELGVFAVNSDCMIQGCVFGETKNGFDTLQMIGKGPKTSMVSDSRFEGGSRDAIDLDGSDCLISRNVLFGFNQGSGIRSRGGRTPTLARNIISECSSGITLSPESEVRINHQTLSRNNIGIDLRGEGQESGMTTGYIRNTLLWGNGTDLAMPPTNLIEIGHSNSAPPLLDGVGNLSLNPLFVDPTDNDFRLRANSPMLRKAENGLDIGAIQQSTGQRSYLLVR